MTAGDNDMEDFFKLLLLGKSIYILDYNSIHPTASQSNEKQGNIQELPQ